MKKLLLLLVIISGCNNYAQNNWTKINKTSKSISKNSERESFPKDFQLYQTSFSDLNTILSQAPNRLTTANSKTIISIPNSIGNLEQFELFEYSNLEPQLQLQYPSIRSYVGKGITDKLATIRLSSDPSGIQAMIFRTDKRNEFIEPYTTDGSVYVIYESQRNRGQLPFVCSTEDTILSDNLSRAIPSESRSSNAQLLNFRLALSCNGEYAIYHGGTIAGALAAMNATMTRVNGVFEKDFAIHMTIIANNTAVIYTNPATDPYSTTLSQWNGQLQSTLTIVIGEANYDVGHMFGATGGGGSAGCIGCVCEDGIKGSGKTSPSDGVPMGDTFDIDYVAHELGHQFGGNHTFSHNTEGSGVNVEPGSGSTIMAYAGITSYDVQPHSDDYFVYGSIKQVQDNMVGKTCPTRTTLTHGAPIVNAGLDFVIPKSTPFILTGTATDSNNDILSYCWEENDAATTETGANSAAIITKTAGPNWRSYDPVSVPFRYFPRIQSIIANQVTTTGSEINVEALSSVARVLNFVLTARDSYAGSGLTGSDSTMITVNGTAGPFSINVPNTAVVWNVGANENVTWNVAGTTSNGVNCNYVDIYLSTNGGTTYPILLASKVPNDGSEIITVPNAIGTTNRIMVKGNNHIFFDISNANFSIVTPTSSFAIAFDGTIGGQNKSGCQGANFNFNLNYATVSGYLLPTTFTVSGNPVGTTAVFSPASISSTGIVSLTLGNTIAAPPGIYTFVVTGTSGALTRTVNLYLEILNASFSIVSLTSPANLSEIASNTVTLNWSADAVATLYTLQVATDSDFNTLFLTTDVSTNSFNLSGLTELTNYFWRVLPKNSACNGVYSSTNRFTTTLNPCSNFASTNIPIAISATGTPTVTSTLTIPTANNATITDINVTVNISHTYTSDVTVSLISPNNTIINLVVNQCTSNNNILATFDDAGITLVCATSPAINGIVKPTQLLAALNGQSSEGVWTLRVVDNADADGGTINNWSLEICSAPIPLTCGQISTTWNGTSWTNGKPLNNVAATINGNLTTTENLTACTLNIIGTSQVILSSGTNATVTGVVNVSPTASLTIENNANLIQVDNVINTANATIYRNSNPLKRFDYTIWSSPVTGNQTLKNFSPNTLDDRFYTYNTSGNIYTSISNPLTQTFATSNGYLIRMPNTHPATPTVWNGQFRGNLNNGNIDADLTYIATGQSFNMIGNPYPSTINANELISSNSSTIFGTLYFWRKTNAASGTAYATYTLGGATTTSPTSPTPNGIIQVGQGFIVEAKNIATPKVAFTNVLRVSDNQNQFFRNPTPIERNRIWLNLTNLDGLFTQSMIGFMTDATEDFDYGIDGKYLNDSPIAFNSILNNDQYAIQLKGLPFQNTAVFPMNFKTDIAGNYTVTIDHLDGIFVDNQTVYLKDNLVQQIHNLTNNSYDFTTVAGNFDNRFEIVFQPILLTTNDNEFNANAVVVYSNQNNIHINSGTFSMSKIKVYDTLGRVLFSKDKLNTTSFIITTLNARNQALFIQIESENGQKTVKKIVY